jgi:hypothetical protein
MHYDFLNKMLQANETYWCVAKMNLVNRLGRNERLDDQIALIAIPYGTNMGIPANDVTFRQIEDLGRAKVDNVFLSEDYPPFQIGITMYDVYDGFPIEGKYAKEFLKQALTLKTTQGIYGYKELYKTISEPTPTV